MTRKILIGALAAAAAVAGFFLWRRVREDRPPSRPPVRNVVLISIDTLRPDRLGCYGYDRNVSPHLDALAADGVRFETVVAQAPWTAPSHASMLTSLYPSVLHIGKFENPGRIPEAAETLAETLRAAGFRTAAVTGGGFVSKNLGFDQGFEIYRNHSFFRQNVQTAVGWLEGLDWSKERFFLFLHTYEVHHYKPREPFATEFVRPYGGWVASEPNVAKLVQNYANRPFIEQFEEDDWRYVSDLYDACLASVDHALGQFLRFLGTRGLLDDTLVVVTSDHGEEFGEHGYSGHGYTMYEENVRVPLIVRHGSLPHGSVVRKQVRVLDIAPTILELAGVEPPSVYQGVSLVPYFEGRGRDLVAYSENAHTPLKAVRTPSLKYIVSPKDPQRQLFDLVKDPAERNSLCGDTPDERERKMLRGMLSWIRENVRRRMTKGPAKSDLDEETKEQLDALGYLGASGGEPPVEAEEWIQLLESFER